MEGAYCYLPAETFVKHFRIARDMWPRSRGLRVVILFAFLHISAISHAEDCFSEVYIFTPLSAEPIDLDRILETKAGVEAMRRTCESAQSFGRRGAGYWP